MPANPSGYDVERYFGDEQIRVAIGFDYDEKLIEKVKSLPYSKVRQEYDPDYVFKSGRERAWTVAATEEALQAIRNQTRLQLPPRDEIPLEEEFVETTNEQLSKTCPRCGEDGVMSTRSMEAVFIRRGEVLQEIIDHEDATHGCYVCHAMIKSQPLQLHQVM